MVFISKKDGHISYKGRYKPINPSKYKGDPTNIIYRSLWERQFMKKCDTTATILEWSSEEIIVNYFSPIDQRVHRYFVDFWIKVQEPDGSVKCKLIEIKPHKQTIEPKPTKKITKKYITEVKNWIINKNKWDAARAYCEKQQWEFLILTENHLFKKNGKQ